MVPAILSLVMLCGEVFATEPLEPQVRVHAGGSWVGGPSPFGATLGADARITRILAMDLSAFLTPVKIDEAEYAYESVEADYYHLRHGIYFDPGIRIPHPQPRTWAWDLFLRGGSGVVWFADTNPDAYGLDGEEHAITAAIAGLAGADAFVRFGKFGVRIAGRAWFYEAQHPRPTLPEFMIQPQATVEALWQF
jgi:hypothetical protein